jgi:ankyrin repeat protein
MKISFFSPALLWILMSGNAMAQVQSSASLSDRSFWKDHPTLMDVQKRVDIGDDPSALGPFDFDPMSWALIEQAPLEVLRFLLGFEGNGVNKLTHDGRSYVFWAAYKDNLPFIKELKELGADFGIVDEHGYSLLNFAAVTGQTNPELYDYLIEQGSDPKTEFNSNGAQALLLLAPFISDDEMVDYFAKFGLSMNDTDKDGSNGFLYACKGGNIDYLKSLVQSGMEATIRNGEGQSAAHFAAIGTRGESNGKELFEFLKENGVDLNQKDEKGVTPLMEYVRGKADAATVTYLAAEAHDLNVVDSDGFSAMHFALSSAEVATVKALMDCGWSASDAPFKSESLFHALAEQYDPSDHDGFSEKIQLLRSKGIPVLQSLPSNETWFHLGARTQSLDMLKFAALLQLDVNHIDEGGMTSLHEACLTARDVENLQWLVDVGADIQITTMFGETAFELAKENEALVGVDLNFLKTE